MKTIIYDDERIEFYNIIHAAHQMDRYQKLLDKIPRGKWIRCKDVDECYQEVAKLLNKMVLRGWAKKRTIDDGFIDKEVSEYEPIDQDGNFSTIFAYTKEGEFIGIVNNPKYKGFKTMTKRTCMKKVPISHTEFYVEPFGDK